MAEYVADRIRKFIDKNPFDKEKDKTWKSYYERVAGKCRTTPGYVRRVIGAKVKVESEEPERSGLEIRGDDIVYNWTNKTIVTSLGEYGNYVCTFHRHGLIQRSYVHAFSGETAASVAMEFDFPHAKAVYKYARIHGFTKSSPGQTDLEFELGLTVEEAVEENIQNKKRKVYKKTQQREWKETVAAAEKWWRFENTLLDELRTIDFVPLKFPKIRRVRPLKNQTPFIGVVGITDVHYLKLCYDHAGRITYNRDIAKKRLLSHSNSLINEVSRYGIPEYFVIAVGNDNIHVDGIEHTTTKGTTQHQATDGMWRLSLKDYFKLQIHMIDMHKQISKVVCLPVKGNHDFKTSIALQSMLEIYYENDPSVEVVTCHDARVYWQWNNICVIWTHGDELKSIPNLEKKAHLLIMGEAKNQGINMDEVTHYLFCHGHEHVGSYKDLNGHVQRIGFSSLSDIDDWWHKGAGFVGREPESKVVIAQKGRGRKAILWA